MPTDTRASVPYTTTRTSAPTALGGGSMFGSVNSGTGNGSVGGGSMPQLPQFPTFGGTASSGYGPTSVPYGPTQGSPYSQPGAIPPAGSGYKWVEGAGWRNKQGQQWDPRAGGPVSGGGGGKKSAAGGGGGAGSSGGGGGSYGGSLPPIQTNAQRDPHLEDMYSAYGSYRNALAGNTDQDARLSMARQRDALSGLMGEMGGNAEQRGISAESGAYQQLQERAAEGGMRSLAGLNADNVSGGRQMQLQALAGQTGTAQASNNALLNQQNYGLDVWLAQQGALQAQAQLDALRESNAWNNQLGLFNAQANLYSNLVGNMYSGF